MQIRARRSRGDWLGRLAAMLTVTVLAACTASEIPRSDADEGAEPSSSSSAEAASGVAGSEAAAEQSEQEEPAVAAVQERESRVEAEDESASPRETLPPLPDFPDEVPQFDRPEHVRGIYLNAWAAGSRRKVRNLLAMVGGTEVNTFVIDLKDATGYVSHRSAVPLVTEIGADKDRRIGNLHGLLWQLKEAGIYPIARIVIMKDPRLTDAYPDMAVQDTAGGPWVDGKGQVWLNPYDRRVWDYHVALAREAVEAGFPEIQWDYVRFPDAPRSEIERTTYPGAEGRTRVEAIRQLLAHTRDELGSRDVPITADVFGVTTSATRDVGIGQVWEQFIDVIDVALPMVYPSHYWKGSFGYDMPNAYPYEIVYEALTDALERSAEVAGAGTTRPWLQDFTLGKPRYEAEHVRAQIQATYDAGIQEWILWNPGSRYTAEALAPADGYPAGQEPLIPVADTLVVASNALAYLIELREAKAAAQAAAEEAERAAQEQRADEGTVGAAEAPQPDSVGATR
jgi:hypothetical protein